MLTDYKISRITETDDEVRVLYRVYEGEFQDVRDADNNRVSQYTRLKVLREFEKTYPKGTDIRLEGNKELALDVTREPIDTQKDVLGTR